MLAGPEDSSNKTLDVNQQCIYDVFRFFKK